MARKTKAVPHDEWTHMVVVGCLPADEVEVADLLRAAGFRVLTASDTRAGGRVVVADVVWRGTEPGVGQRLEAVARKAEVAIGLPNGPAAKVDNVFEYGEAWAPPTP